MNYEVIDEEQKIAACHIADLTIEQTVSMLKQWEAGAKIGSLTLFYDEQTGYVVLNKDNKRYHTLLGVTREILKADKKNREELERKAPESLLEEITVLKIAASKREVLEELEKVGKQGFEKQSFEVLEAIWKKSPDMFGMVQSYTYGVMQGKRKERAKRKKTCCQEAV